MLAAAKRRLAGQDVELIHGGAPELGHHEADLAIMTGHVAQFFLTDAEWQTALKSLHQALKPGAHLAFESRNPLIPPYTKWPTPTAHRRLHDPQAGPVEWWLQDRQPSGNRLSYALHYLFADTGEEVTSHNELIFRSRAQITTSLQAAGFTVEHVYGNWDATPATDDSKEMIFVTKRN
ncbi:MAG: putative methyltransferase [Patescibacteria group bacterium]|nr:putative methyltransferase [Patescibacteria group bacterium]